MRCFFIDQKDFLPDQDCQEELPSPEKLMHKILIKNKKIGPLDSSKIVGSLLPEPPASPQLSDSDFGAEEWEKTELERELSGSTTRLDALGLQPEVDLFDAASRAVSPEKV